MEDKELFYKIINGLCSNTFYAENHWDGGSIAAKAIEIYKEIEIRVNDEKIKKGI